MSLIQKTFNVSPTAFQAQGLRGSPPKQKIGSFGKQSVIRWRVTPLQGCRVVYVVTTGSRGDVGPGSAQPHPGNKCSEPEALMDASCFVG